MGIDPGATINKPLVESIPNSRFVHAAVSDKQTNETVYGKDKGEYAYRDVKVVNFIELIARENQGRLVDFMSVDIEGAEFSLLPLLHSAFINTLNFGSKLENLIGVFLKLMV